VGGREGGKERETDGWKEGGKGGRRVKKEEEKEGEAYIIKEQAYIHSHLVQVWAYSVHRAIRDTSTGILCT